MKNLSLLFLLIASASAPISAQTQAPIRLQCDGKYFNYVMNPPVHDAEVRGIYIEMSDEQVKVVNAPGFENAYLIFGRNEASINWKLASNDLIGGNLNRFSGELHLFEQNKDRKSFKQAIWGVCRRAQPLF